MQRIRNISVDKAKSKSLERLPKKNNVNPQREPCGTPNIILVSTQCAQVDDKILNTQCALCK